MKRDPSWQETTDGATLLHDMDAEAACRAGIVVTDGQSRTAPIGAEENVCPIQVDCWVPERSPD